MVPKKCGGNVVNISTTCPPKCVEMWWKCGGNVMEMVWKGCGNVLWKCGGIVKQDFNYS